MIAGFLLLNIICVRVLGTNWHIPELGAIISTREKVYQVIGYDYIPIVIVMPRPIKHQGSNQCRVSDQINEKINNTFNDISDMIPASGRIIHDNDRSRRGIPLLLEILAVGSMGLSLSN
jgi:hypothetical protein